MSIIGLILGILDAFVSTRSASKGQKNASLDSVSRIGGLAIAGRLPILASVIQRQREAVALALEASVEANGAGRRGVSVAHTLNSSIHRCLATWRGGAPVVLAHGRSAGWVN